MAEASHKQSWAGGCAASFLRSGSVNLADIGKNIWWRFRVRMSSYVAGWAVEHMDR